MKSNVVQAMNKKRKFIVFVFILAAFFRGAPATHAEPFQFGFKGGLALAKTVSSFNVEQHDLAFNAEGEPDGSLNYFPKTRAGWRLGVFVNYGICKIFSIQPELYYVQRGLAYSSSFDEGPKTTDTVNGNYRHDCIELPILAKFSLPLNGDLKTAFYIGPSVFSSLHTQYTAHWTSSDGTSETEIYSSSTHSGNVAGVTNHSTLRFNADIGTEISYQNYLLDIRYSYGMPYTDDLGDKYSYRLVSIMAGYRFFAGSLNKQEKVSGAISYRLSETEMNTKNVSPNATIQSSERSYERDKRIFGLIRGGYMIHSPGIGNGCDGPSFNGICAYAFSHHFSGGVGIGADGYYSYGFHRETFYPMFLDLREQLLRGAYLPHLFQEVGYSAGSRYGQQGFFASPRIDIGGFMLAGGIGIDLYIDRKTAVVFDFGYKIQNDTLYRDFFKSYTIQTGLSF